MTVWLYRRRGRGFFCGLQGRNSVSMTKENICILIAMAVYMIAVLVIGIVCARRNKTADDFYLGGRKLGPLVTAMSAEASDMSSWLLMGLPGLAFLTGISDAGWTAIGLAVGTYVNWLIVAKRLRRYSVVANNSITLPDFFSNRFGDKHKVLMSISALIILIFFVPYAASGFAACGKLFSSLFNVPYIWAMIISAVVIVAYTAIGGFLAASTTDLMQGILMSVALVVVFVFGVVTAGVPILAVENIEGYIPWDGESGCFVLRVRGDSMIGAGILDGDKVVVRPQPDAENGQIVVALLDDSATVKRLKKTGRDVWLMPENPSYEPIPGNEAKILGRVKALIREY